MSYEWRPKHELQIPATDAERRLYEDGNVRCVYHGFQWPIAGRKGIDKRGHFPIAVVRKHYADLGYECWISARDNDVCPSYLLERLPIIGQQRRNRAYVRIEREFGPELMDRFHKEAAGKRKESGLRAAGGDPDLFVKHLRNATDKFFVEVKLTDAVRRHKDTLNEQQLLLFPLIEEMLKCDVRVASVSIVPKDMTPKERGLDSVPTPTSPAEIIWTEASDLEHVGHGVLFGHEDHPRVAIAFAVGFEWLHQPGTPVNVRLLSCKPPGISSDEWPNIKAQVIQGVEKSFGMLGESVDAQAISPIWRWING